MLIVRFELNESETALFVALKQRVNTRGITPKNFFLRAMDLELNTMPVNRTFTPASEAGKKPVGRPSKMEVKVTHRERNLALMAGIVSMDLNRQDANASWYVSQMTGQVEGFKMAQIPLPEAYHYLVALCPKYGQDANKLIALGKEIEMSGRFARNNAINDRLDRLYEAIIAYEAETAVEEVMPATKEGWLKRWLAMPPPIRDDLEIMQETLASMGSTLKYDQESFGGAYNALKAEAKAFNLEGI